MPKPVPPESINNPFIIVDFVNKDLEDLIHKDECLVSAEFLCQRGESLHVDEHDGDLSPLSFYPVSLSKGSFQLGRRGGTLDLASFSSKERSFGGRSCPR